MASINKAMERIQNGVATINECARRLNGIKPLTEIQSRFIEVKLKITLENKYCRYRKILGPGRYCASCI